MAYMLMYSAALDIECDEPGCKRGTDFVEHSVPQVFAAARAAGWMIGKARVLCPDHSGKRTPTPHAEARDAN